MTDEMADIVVNACGERGKIVAEEQRKAAEEEAVRKAADGSTADALLGGSIRDTVVETDAGAESAADSILGGPVAAPEGGTR